MINRLKPYAKHVLAWLIAFLIGVALTLSFLFKKQKHTTTVIVPPIKPQLDKVDAKIETVNEAPNLDADALAKAFNDRAAKR